MKKFLLFLTTAILVFALAACSQKAKPEAETKKENTSELTLEQVFDQMLKKQEELKSVKSIVSLDQSLEMPAEGVTINSKMDMDIDAVLSPLSMYMKNKTKMKMQGGDLAGLQMPGQLEMESYFTKDGLFTLESTSGEWTKLPDSMSKEVLAASEEQMNPAEQLKQLKEFIQDFNFEQNDTQYILKLTASGEKFTKLVQDEIAKAMPGEADADILKDMKIDNLNYEIYVDKKTFYTTQLNLVFDIHLKVEGDEAKVSQTIKSTYSKFNEINEIKVPQEVLDKAKSME